MTPRGVIVMDVRRCNDVMDAIRYDVLTIDVLTSLRALRTNNASYSLRLFVVHNVRPLHLLQIASRLFGAYRTLVLFDDVSYDRNG